MRKILLTAIAALALASCQEVTYPLVHQAVIDHVQAQVGQDAKLTIREIRTADSLTMGQLYDQRIKAFNTKLSQDTKLYEKYKGQKMEANAAKHKKAIEKDKAILKGLEAMAPDIASISDVVVCYDVNFSGQAKTPELTTVFDNYWAAVTVGGVVLSTNNELRGLHKGFGKFIPGYSDLLHKVGDEDAN